MRNHYDSLSKDSLYSQGKKQKSQRSFFKYGFYDSKESMLLAEELQSHTE